MKQGSGRRSSRSRRSPSARVLLLGLFALGVLAACGDRRIIFCDAMNPDVDTGGCGVTGGAGGVAAGGTGGAGGGSSGSGGGGAGAGGTVSAAGSGGSGGGTVEAGGSGGNTPLDASVIAEDAGLDAGDAASP